MKAGEGGRGGNSGPRGDMEAMSEGFERRSGEVPARLRRESLAPPSPHRAPTAAVCPRTAPLSPPRSRPPGPAFGPSGRLGPDPRAALRPTRCPATRTGNCCSASLRPRDPESAPPPRSSIRSVRPREAGGTGPGPAVEGGTAEPQAGTGRASVGNVGPRCRERDGSAPHPKAGRGVGDTKGLGSASAAEPGLRAEPGTELTAPVSCPARRSVGWDRVAPSIPWVPSVRPGRPELSPTQPCAALQHECCACVRVCAHTHGVRDHACAPCPARAPHPSLSPHPAESRPTPGARTAQLPVPR